MNKTNSKIKVVQYMHGPFFHFEWSERINRSYCDRHGYDYVVRRDSPRSDRNPSWQKIEAIRQELHDCDYLLYLDSDAFFHGREFKIERELLPLLGGKSIMMAQNFMSETIRRVPRYPNSGVVLLVNNEAAKRFLAHWNDSSSKDPVGRWISPYEDINLWRLTLAVFKQHFAFIEDYYQLNGHFGLYIRHLQGFSNSDRTAQMIRFVHDSFKADREKEPESRPKIRVIQYMYGSFEYFRWSKTINSAYCVRHGYEYHIDATPPREDRHVVWQKIDTMLRYLDRCDYLLFLDADAVFYGHEWRIEEHLFPLMDDRDILMAQDITFEKSRWTPGYPNAGVVLVKSNRDTRMFMEMWRNIPDIDPSLRNLWPPMQLALWRYLMPAFPNMVKVLDEYYLMNGALGQYIRHYMIHSDKERTEAMKRYCDERQIDL